MMYTVPETNSSHLKIDGWIFPVWMAYLAYFHGRAVSFGQGKLPNFGGIKQAANLWYMFRYFTEDSGDISGPLIFCQHTL